MSRNYWKKRFEKLEDRRNQDAAAFYADVQKQFSRAEAATNEKIELWYERIAENNDVSLADAKKLLKKNELEEFKWTVEEYIAKAKENEKTRRWVKELENASARAHISRYEALNLSIRHNMEMLYGGYEKGMEDFLGETYKDMYFRTGYEAAIGTGIGHNFAKIDSQRLKLVMGKTWAADERSFSDRIWTDKKKLINELHDTLSQSIIRGDSPEQMIEHFAKRMGVSRRAAGRLIMTESAAIASAAEFEALKDLGVEEYEILATLDSHTSEICRGMDGKVFKLSEYEIGVTAPPFHPCCRTTTVPYFDDEFTEEEERAARGADGKVHYVPANMKYKEWMEVYVNNTKPAHKSHKLLERLDLLAQNVVISKLREYESQIVRSDIENAIVITRDGDVIQCFGTQDEVYPDVDLGEKLKGASVTHNHPNTSSNEYSFSKSDIDLFMNYDLALLRGIDEKYIYELTRNADDIDSLQELWEIDEYSARHNVVISKAQQYGIGYRRYRRE